MKRGDARELAVHLIYGRAFTGEEPEQVVSTRLDKEYYGKLAEENEVYAQRPDRFQLRYIDSVVTGVANREDELDDVIRQFSIGWDISRISKLARCILRLAGASISVFRLRTKLPKIPLINAPVSSPSYFFAMRTASATATPVGTSST